MSAVRREVEDVDIVEEDRRGHARYAVNQPCRAVFGGREFRCRIENLSVAGANVALDMKMAEHPYTLDVQPPLGTSLQLHLEGIGLLQTKVVWTGRHGLAVEFDLDEETDKRVVDTFRSVLDELAKKQGAQPG